MAVTLLGSRGLFTILGHMARALRSVNTFRGTTYPATLATAVTELDGGSVALRDTVIPALLRLDSAGRTNQGSLQSDMKSAAQRLLIFMVDADNPLPSLDVRTALLELKRQMRISGHFIQPNVVSASATQTNLDGNGAIVTCVQNTDGETLHNLLAQDVEIAITSTATPGSESLLLTAEEGPRDLLSERWPGGSNDSWTLSAIDAASTSRNLLTDGGLEGWSGTPLALDDWPIIVGVYGTDLLQEAATFYKGTFGAEWVGGATLTQIRQDITSKVRAGQILACNSWWRHDGVAPAAGIVTVDLYDGTAVITNEAGTDLSFTIALTGLSGSFVAKNGVFLIPRDLPTSVFLRVRVSTALTAGRSVFMDHVALAEMAAGAVPGQTPYVAAFGGSLNWSNQDKTHVDPAGTSRTFKLAAANDRVSDWCNVLDQFFDTTANDIIFPTTGGTLVDDALMA